MKILCLHGWLVIALEVAWNILNPNLGLNSRNPVPTANKTQHIFITKISG